MIIRGEYMNPKIQKAVVILMLLVMIAFFAASIIWGMN